MLERARRLGQDGEPYFLIIEGDPEIKRLQFLGQLPQGAMASDREAMIGEDYYAAGADETTEAFHARMCAAAKQCGALNVSLGHKSNITPPKEAAPYSPVGAAPGGSTLN